MENNKNKKKSFFQKLFQSNYSVIASFVVAVIAIVSLVVVGFNQISYAIPDVESPITGGGFTFGETSNNRIISDGGFSVAHYKTSTGTTIYCLEHNNTNVQAGAQYTQDGQITDDYGLLYILANTYNGVDTPTSMQGLDDNLKIWLTQVTIWYYLAKTDPNNNQENISGGSNPLYLSEEDIAKIQKSKYVYHESSSYTNLYGADHDKTLFEQYIDPIYQEAMNHRNIPNKILNINKDSDNIFVTDDEDYYQSDRITVTGSPTENFNGFSLQIVSAPEGTIIVNSNGEEIKDLDNLPNGTEFYVRVPVNKITEENKIVKISATGSFKTYEGFRYVSEGHQTVVTVQTVNNNTSTGLDIDLSYTPDVPDTSMNVAQSVYFIGLVILLSGIGIMYANVRPKESK